VRSDFELLDAWRAGDRGAGNTLVERHFLSLYRFFRNKLGGDIDDLIQRVFLACVESRDAFRKEASFRTYLFAVARNELHAHFRRERRDAVLDFGELSVEDLGPSPSQLVAREEEQRVLLRALRMIPLDYQIALELFYWEQLTGRELAAVLDIPEGTARTRLRRARSALAQRLSRLIKSPDVLRSTTDNLDRWAASLRECLAAEGRKVG
jgi:RNA polymerase sigma-70 factor (ECF subfamily)